MFLVAALKKDKYQRYKLKRKKENLEKEEKNEEKKFFLENQRIYQRGCFFIQVFVDDGFWSCRKMCVRFLLWICQTYDCITYVEWIP